MEVVEHVLVLILTGLSIRMRGIVEVIKYEIAS
jgi:hypothetical protein